MNNGNEVGWMLGGVTTVIAALAGVVSVLWKVNESKNSSAIVDLQKRVDESEQKNEECRRDREDLRIEIAAIRERLLSCQMCNECPARNSSE